MKLCSFHSQFSFLSCLLPSFGSKVLRLIEIAQKSGLPCIYLIDVNAVEDGKYHPELDLIYER